MKNKIKLPDTITLSDDFKEMLNLLGVYTEATNRLTALESQCNGELLEIVDEHKADYAEAQQAATQSETALEVIALRHPEWFTQKQSVATPYGTVKFHNGTKLEVANEEVTILLIEQRSQKAEEANEKAKDVIDAFNSMTFLRHEKKLNLEALEKLSTGDLNALRIQRVPNKTFSVKPAKIDMGKAVKEAAEVAS